MNSKTEIENPLTCSLRGKATKKSLSWISWNQLILIFHFTRMKFCVCVHEICSDHIVEPLHVIQIVIQLKNVFYCGHAQAETHT